MSRHQYIEYRRTLVRYATIVVVASITLGLWFQYGEECDQHIRNRGYLSGHHDKITALVFSSTGDLLYSSSWDGLIREWNLSTLRLNRQFSCHVDGTYIEDIALSPEERSLASVGSDGNLYIIDLRSGRYRSSPISSWGLYSVEYLSESQVLIGTGHGQLVSFNIAFWRQDSCSQVSTDPLSDIVVDVNNNNALLLTAQGRQVTLINLGSNNLTEVNLGEDCLSVDGQKDGNVVLLGRSGAIYQIDSTAKIEEIRRIGTIPGGISMSISNKRHPGEDGVIAVGLCRRWFSRVANLVILSSEGELLREMNTYSRCNLTVALGPGGDVAVCAGGSIRKGTHEIVVWGVGKQ